MGGNSVCPLPALLIGVWHSQFQQRWSQEKLSKKNLYVKWMIGSASYKMICTKKYGRKILGVMAHCPPVAPSLSSRTHILSHSNLATCRHVKYNISNILALFLTICHPFAPQWWLNGAEQFPTWFMRVGESPCPLLSFKRIWHSLYLWWIFLFM